MNICQAIKSLTFVTLLANAATTASAEVYEGTVVADAHIESERATVVITGQAAYGMFWVTAFRMRLEELAIDVRRARGRDMTCYAYGQPIDAIEQWVYTCHMVVGEFGELKAPPIPADHPPPPETSDPP